MIRWTVFDTSTAAAVASHLAAGGSLQVASGDPLAAALAAEDPVTYALLPSSKHGEVILARIERKKQPDAELAPAPPPPPCEAPTDEIADAAATVPPESPQGPGKMAEECTSEQASDLNLLPSSTENGPIRYEAGGFLGLSDEPVYKTDYRTPKNWWQRMWG